jgi:hypothetical protein
VPSERVLANARIIIEAPIPSNFMSEDLTPNFSFPEKGCPTLVIGEEKVPSDYS